MEQYLLIVGETCNKCKFIEKYVEERTKGTGISYDKKLHNECGFDITTIPTLIHTKDGVEIERFEDTEEIISLIQN